MEVLFVFLKWVASFAHLDEETGSKMDLTNLATVICPSILYSRSRDAMRDESFGAIRVITMLLENQDEFFAVPEEFLPILHDQEYFSTAMELPAKDFMKKCDTYQKVKSGNGRPLNNMTNGSNSRFPSPMSPMTERPPLGGPTASEQTIRPHARIPQSSNSFSPGIAPPRTPDEWPGTPRPINASQTPSSTSRPNSFVQPPRSSFDQQTSLSPSLNGYQRP